MDKTQYFSLDHDGKPVTLLIAKHVNKELYYFRWDVPTKKWVEDSTIMSYIMGIGGSTDSTPLNSKQINVLSRSLGITPLPSVPTQ
jgi:hypothetical protein